MEKLKALWSKKPVKYSLIVAAVVALFIIVAQFNAWVTG